MNNLETPIEEMALAETLKNVDKQPKPQAPKEPYEEREKEIRISQRKRSLAKQVGKRYANCSIKDFNLYGTEEEQAKQQKVLDQISLYAKNLKENISKGQGVVFFGSQGTGKDHLLISLALYAVSKDFHVEYVRAGNLFTSIKDRISTSSKIADRVKELLKPDVLVISDPIPASGELTRYELNFFSEVIEARYSALKPTWITANFFSAEEAVNVFSSPVIDRMKDDSLTCYFKWSSYRKAADFTGNE